MKSKTIDKIVSQLYVKVTKRPSGTIAGKRIQHVRMIKVKIANEDKKGY